MSENSAMAPLDELRLHSLLWNEESYQLAKFQCAAAFTCHISALHACHMTTRLCLGFTCHGTVQRAHPYNLDSALPSTYLLPWCCCIGQLHCSQLQKYHRWLLGNLQLQVGLDDSAHVSDHVDVEGPVLIKGYYFSTCQEAIWVGIARSYGHQYGCGPQPDDARDGQALSC